MLGLPMTKGNPHTFATAAESFTTDWNFNIENAMLPCLSTNRTFTAKLMVVPAQETSNYNIIPDQDSMQSLDLGTSV
jgi:hypothetical protein